ncbi:MAG: hypothetical protein ACR2NM_05820, partial [Bythopirellula sp.]
GFSPRRSLQQSLLGVTAVVMAISLLNWCLPEALGTGLARLANPMNHAEWPREHDLQFVAAPTLLAAGDDLVLQLQDTHGQLPAEIMMVYRSRRRGRWVERRVSHTATENPQEIRLVSVQESLQFRATGGDHRTMPWHTLEVIPPPRLVDWTLTIHPPDYTFEPTTTWDKHSAILIGSRLQLQGRMDEPIEEVVLQSASGVQVTANVEPGGRTFQIDESAWQVMTSATYHFHVTTPAGLQTELETPLTLNVIVDQPPQVRLVEPISDLSILSGTALPLAVEVTDDLAVQEIELVYQRSDRSDQGEQRLSLWRAASNRSLASEHQQQRVEYVWQLDALNLAAGSVVEVHVQATDYQPATGQTSQPLRLTIVTEAELWQQILQRQEQLSVTLARLLREQRDLRSVTAVWEELPEWTLSRWATASHTALFNQRQIKAALADGQHSVLAQMKSLLQTMERNSLVRPDVTAPLVAIQSSLQGLVEGPLAELEMLLSEIVRQSQGPIDHARLSPLISTTAEYQAESIESLKRAIELLMPGNIVGQMERELSAIEADQSALIEYSRVEVAPKVFQPDQAEQTLPIALAEAGRRQRELARRLAEWLLNSRQAGQRLAGSEPALAERLAETEGLGEDLGTLSTMQTAAEQLALRRVGRSMANQQQVLEDLADLRAQLSGQHSQRAAQRLMALQATEKELRRLREQVAALEREIGQLRAEQIDNMPERFRRRRQALAEQTSRISGNLEQLRIPRAARATRDATSELRRSASGAKSVKQARQQIDVAKRELAAVRRRQQVAMAQNEMAKLGAKLGAFLDRQKAIQTEIGRLEQDRQELGTLAEPTKRIVSQLADRQLTLAAEVQSQSDELQTLPVFTFLLREAGYSMRRVAEQLNNEELHQPTQEAAANAVRQLGQLAEVLQQARQSLSSSGDGSGGAGPGQNGSKAQAQTLELALGQLRLLKLLQSALKDRTEAYERERTSQQPLTAVASELARQQQQLTELARQLVPEPEDPADQP